uniref:Uncharacterized protein n=1 Tax=Pipistrellus kuhlii TaxID=59472 RepID=A0A7J7R9E9_PIPKU|nr:hypothetical protein mPipKuh1_010709 [Pipistrellus kuhlii]
MLPTGAPSPSRHCPHRDPHFLPRVSGLRAPQSAPSGSPAPPRSPCTLLMRESRGRGDGRRTLTVLRASTHMVFLCINHHCGCSPHATPHLCSRSVWWVMLPRLQERERRNREGEEFSEMPVGEEARGSGPGTVREPSSLLCISPRVPVAAPFAEMGHITPH